jgi:hypothetical protein
LAHLLASLPFYVACRANLLASFLFLVPFFQFLVVAFLIHRFSFFFSLFPVLPNKKQDF